MFDSPYGQWLLVQAFPSLRKWPLHEWPTVLAEARQVDFDPLERAGIIASVVLVSILLRPAAATETSVAWAFLTQCLLALPLLLVTAGPLMLRRIRRGLKEVSDRRIPRDPPA